VIDVLTAGIPAEGASMTSMIEEQTAAAASAGSQDQKAEKKANAAPQKPRVATGKGKSGKKATPAKKADKAPKAAKTPKAPKADKKAAAAREGSKTATVLAMIQRAKGATLAEIMEATNWQAHSVRGFISGTMGKKMGLKVESSKREDGTRVYSISK